MPKGRSSKRNSGFKTTDPKTAITGKTIITTYMRLLYAVAFYPVMIGLLIWVNVKGFHWGYSLLIVAIILSLDPLWRIIFTNILKWLGRKN